MMTALFRIILLVGVLIYLGLIVWLMRKGRLGLKYALLWLLTGLILLICDIFPGIIRGAASLIGVYSEVNAVFFVGVCFLLLIILFLTSVASELSDKVRGLAQGQAILEKRLRELEEICGRGGSDGGQG